MIKRTSNIYHKNHLENKITVSWEYDGMDRVIKEIESDQKITLFSYDIKGRLIRKILPNGIALQYK